MKRADAANRLFDKWNAICKRSLAQIDIKAFKRNLRDGARIRQSTHHQQGQTKGGNCR